MKKRLSHIDLLKSIAILFVVIYHSQIYTFDFLYNDTFTNHILYFFRTILATCVPLFFFTNGYLLFNKEFNLKKHISKITKLIFSTFIWGIILMPIYIILSKQNLNLKTIINSLLSLDISYSMNIFWFIGALICIYILFPALKSLFDKDKKSFIFFIISCSILTFGFKFINQIVFITKNYFNHTLTNINFSFLTMFNPFHGSYGYSFVYFCIGGLICTYEEKILNFSKKARNICSIIGIIFSSFCLYFIGLNYSKINNKLFDVVWNGYDSFFTFANVIFIYLLSLNYTKNTFIIKNISQHTLGIYYIHTLIIKLIKPQIITYYFFCNFHSNIIFAILIVIICTIICILFKKIPILNKII